MTSPFGVPIGPRPCGANEAVARALLLLAAPSNAITGYRLGTGDYAPGVLDLPWTQRDGVAGADCAGFAICWCYRLRRHRPGFNAGAWATVSDDLNCDSAIEDAEHARELFVLVDQQAANAPQPGDLLVYPTIRLPGHPLPWIGHVAIVTGVARAAAWDPAAPRYDLLDVAQCCGGQGREPAVIASDGSVWTHHDQLWPLPQHRTRMLRLVP